MIALHQVTKYFRTPNGKKYIVKDITLQIPDGSVGILGRNGAGKSTLMRMLGGIEHPNKGTIRSSGSFSWPLGLSGGLVSNLTGRANVKFVCDLYGKSREEKKQIIAYVKEFSELGEYFDMPIKKYSSGMRSRLNFGVSLAFDFDYLLIDEILSVGDAKFRQKARNTLKEKLQNCWSIIVSHDMKTLREMCQSGLVVHHGNLEYYESIEDAIVRYQEINKGAS